jgi:hypothetical protein
MSRASAASTPFGLTVSFTATTATTDIAPLSSLSAVPSSPNQACLPGSAHTTVPPCELRRDGSREVLEDPPPPRFRCFIRLKIGGSSGRVRSRRCHRSEVMVGRIVHGFLSWCLAWEKIRGDGLWTKAQF